jgi:hypothetical protein
MMQLVDSEGRVLQEKEKTHSEKAKMSSARTRNMLKGLKKDTHPTLMSREEFINTMKKDSTDDNI